MRRRRRRRIGCLPSVDYFKPRGAPLSSLQEVVLTLDEFEAIRLADLEGLYQDAAAKEMGISRQTFGRILEEAHRKVADAIINAKALRVEGGEVELRDVDGTFGRGWGRRRCRYRRR